MTIYSPPQNYIVFNGRSLKDFDVYVSGEGTFLSPEREFTSVSVPGKNGDLLFDGGRYKNITITYPSFILENLKKNLIGLRAWLMGSPGYSRLEDTYHPEEYRLAAFVGPLELGDVYWLDAGTFDLSFNCKPQRFLKSGEIPILFEGPGEILNETNFPAKPLIRVYGTGEVTIGGSTIEIVSSPYDYTDVDSEIQDCYYLLNNCNNNVLLSSGEFPILSPGVTNISFGEGISRIEISPRWWTL